MATKNLDAYKLGVVLDASGAAKGVTALKDADKAATKTYSSLTQLSKSFKFALADKFKSELKEVENLSRTSAVGKVLGGIVGDGLKNGITSVFTASNLGKLIGTAIAPGVGTVVGSVIGAGVDAALEKISGPLQAQIQRGIELNKQLELAKLHYTAFTGSEKDAAAHLDALKKLSRDAGLDLPMLLTADQRLEEFNDDVKLSELELRAAADAAAKFGSGAEGFNSVANALGLIAERGELSSKTLVKLYKQGINAPKYLSEALGLSEAKVKELIAKNKLRGDVAARLIAEGIEVHSGGYAQRVANSTLAGREAQFAALQDSLAQRGTVNITGGLKDIYGVGNSILASSQAGGVVDFLNNAAGGILSATKSAVSAGYSFTAGVVEGIASGDALNAIKEGVTKVADTAVGTFKSLLGIQSPSQVTKEQIGVPMAQGVVVGFEEYMAGEGAGRISAALDNALAQGRRGSRRSFSPVSPNSGERDFSPELKQPASIETARRVLQRLQELRATEAQIQAAFAAIFNESGFNSNAVGDGGTALGLFQQHGSYGSRAARFGIESSVAGFLREAMRVDPSGRYGPGDLAANVERPAPQNRYKYGANLPESNRYLSFIRGLEGVGPAGGPVPVVVTNQQQGGDGRGSFASLSPDDQLKVIKSLLGTGFGYSAGDLRGGYGVLDAPQQSYTQTLKDAVPVVVEITEKQQLLDTTLDRSTLATTVFLQPLEKVPGVLDSATNATYAYSQSVEENRKAAIRAADTLTNIAGALGQVAGMLPSGGQVGKKRGFFSKVLGIAAPFLSFIPGVGPMLSHLATIGSNALAGNWAGVVSGFAEGLQPGGFMRGKGSSSDASLGDVSTSDSNPRSFDFGGRRATGGPVRRGRAYVVGEYRNEVFEPNEDGYIHPSVDAYLRSAHGGPYRGGDTGIGAMLTRLEEHFARLSSVPMDHVFTYGARRNPGVVFDAFVTHVSRDASAVEFMNRRMAA